jgi:hypothetical protein
LYWSKASAILSASGDLRFCRLGQLLRLLLAPVGGDLVIAMARLTGVVGDRVNSFSVNAETG